MTDEGSIGWTGYEALDELVSGELHQGVVREWHDEEGWGVIDSPETPGGCWTHFSVIVSAGYRQLDSGSSVAFTTERAQQDGYSYRALQVFPRGSEVRSQLATDAPAAYRSTLTVTVDGEAVDPEPGLREPQPEGATAVLDLQLRRFSREAMQRLRNERDELRRQFEK